MSRAWIRIACFFTMFTLAACVMEADEMPAPVAGEMEARSFTESSAPELEPDQTLDQQATPCSSGAASEQLLGQHPELAASDLEPGVASGRCPSGCYEANVACTGFILWNSCWCNHCPTGGWWVGGACIGGYQWSCGDQIAPQRD